jgi:hypothetical protein
MADESVKVTGKSYWESSVTGVMNTLRDALVAIAPHLVKMKIPLKDTPLVDSWDDISQTMYYYFIIETVRYAVPDFGEKGYGWAEYEHNYDDYSRLSLVEAVRKGGEVPDIPADHHLVFHSFQSGTGVFDVVRCRVTDGKMKYAGRVLDLDPRNLEYRFRWRMKDGTAKYLDDLKVEL